MVGFKTNLTYTEQRCIFKLIPGLKMPNLPVLVKCIEIPIRLLLYFFNRLQINYRNDFFISGQLTGMEGYIGNIATGLVAGLNAERYLKALPLLEFPVSTMIYALIHYIMHTKIKTFQPIKVNFGILPALTKYRKGKRERAMEKSKRSLNDLHEFISNNRLYIIG